MKNVKRLTNMKYFTALVWFLLLIQTSYSSAQEASNIWIGRFNDAAKHPISELFQLTDTDTYTNQPYFFDNRYLFFSQMEGDGDLAQTDVFSFDLNTGESKNMTKSSHSEYSPTPLPGLEQGFSVVRVDEQDRQTVYKFDMQGAEIGQLAVNYEPVGYHLWVDADLALLFVLGEPNFLVLANTDSGRDEDSVFVDDNIGASLYRYLETPIYLYSKTSEEDGHWLYSFNSDSKKSRQLVKMPDEVEYFTVSPKGYVLTSDGKNIFMQYLAYDNQSQSIVKRQGMQWRVVTPSSSSCKKGVSRMQISPDNSMIALVCLEAE